MNCYVLKRKYTNTYYTIRNDNNKPSIIAFTYAGAAKKMLNTIKIFEEHKQPLVVEKLSHEFLYRSCKSSLLPAVIYGDKEVFKIDPDVNTISYDDACFYLRNKFMYF